MNLEESLAEFKKNFDPKLGGVLAEHGKRHVDPLLDRDWKLAADYCLLRGKRLRPYILSRMNEEFRHVTHMDDILVAFELLHNSTLMDDDIFDHHKERGGIRTPFSYANGAALSAALATELRTLGMQLVLEADVPDEFRRECLATYATLTQDIYYGQLLDLKLRNNLITTEQDYLRQAQLVTARFFERVCYLGAAERREKLALLGENIGIIFQLADDLLDINTLQPKGRERGADIREGKMHLLAIHTHAKLTDPERSAFRDTYGNPHLSEADIGWVIMQYERMDAVKYVLGKIRMLNEQANIIATSIGLPQDHWTRELVRYAGERKI